MLYNQKMTMTDEQLLKEIKSRDRADRTAAAKIKYRNMIKRQEENAPDQKLALKVANEKIEQLTKRVKELEKRNNAPVKRFGKQLSVRARRYKRSLQKAKTKVATVGRPSAKSGQKQKQVRITIEYTVTLYKGRETFGTMTKKESSYYAITFKDQKEYEDKIDQAKYDMYKSIWYNLVSGSEITDFNDCKFTVDSTLSMRQLNAHASDPTKILFYGKKGDTEKELRVPTQYHFIPADLNIPEEAGVSCLDQYILKT
jgi:hypothetical protein